MRSMAKGFSYVSRFFLFFCLVLISAVCLAGCSEQDYVDSEVQDVETTSIESMDDVLSELDASESEGLIGQDLKDESEVLKKYESQYQAPTAFQDLFVSQKYLFLGSENVVQLLILDGYEQSVVIPWDSISHVEKKTIDNFVTIEIYDKMGKCISFQASATNAESILDRLNQ